MTPDQQAAIDTTDGEVAIRAGAGSGKTTVLAHRFAHALVPREPGGEAHTAIDRVLTITFTNKAAGEIAERVRRVVVSELGADEGRRVAEAWISTIHALCARLLRRHILESGVEPYFAMADEVATRALKNEAFEKAAAGLYGSDRRVAAAVDAFTVSQLRESVIACHDNARALGLEPRHATVQVGMEEVEPLASEVELCSAALSHAMELAKQTESVREKRERLESWRTTLRSCLLSDSDACERLLELDDAYDISNLRDDAHAANVKLKEARRELRCALVAVGHAGILGGIETLMRKFAEEYELVKAQRALLDFDDLQEKAVSLLEGESLIAQRYREHFDLLMVDEFQDTNELQMRVLAPLRSNNLCIVGDERQSIYGFRYADVEIFESLVESIDQRIPLRANFRSHAEILGFVNAAFSMPHLFGPSFMRLEAARTEEGRMKWADHEPRVECLFVGDEAVGRAGARVAEAKYIAQRIRTLIDSGVRGGDIAVLLRGAGSVNTYSDALDERGIPALVSAGASLFDAPEVDDVSALLRAIAVPVDDRALLTVLAGRMVGLSDDALLAVRRSAGRAPLWSGLQRLARGEVAVPELGDDDRYAIGYTVEAIDRLGSSASITSLAELVRRACEAFDYDLTLYAATGSGARAWDNVLKIVRYADAFERAESNDTVEFVEYLKRRGESGNDKAAPAQAGDDAVQVMTIHAAKGLEFPIVFVPDLTAAKSREPAAVLVERGGFDGVAVPVVGVRLPKTTFGEAATAAHIAMANRRRLRDVEEEKRCLYVACTRAEELLVLSGCSSLDKPADEGRGLIDWIREAVPEGENELVRVGESSVRVTTLRPEGEERVGHPEWEPMLPAGPIFAPVERDESVGEEPVAPDTISFSALRNFEECPLSFYGRHVLQLGVFKSSSDSPALRFGSAVHAMLQGSGLHRVPEEHEESIAVRNGLSKAERTELKETVSAFLGSKLAERVRAADRFAAEEPLSVPLGPTLLVGSIDLLAWSGSSALIVDYKTGRAPESGENHDAYRLQAECYALAALEAGAEKAEVVFAFLHHADVTVTFHFGRDDTAPLRAKLTSMLQAALGGDPTHLPAHDERVCRDCPALGGLCPIAGPGRQA
jgi:ATP-dependent exoDNAse (exonuclease V) beta subunit